MTNEAVLAPRALGQDERALLRWLLERGGPDARALLPQVDRARVAGRCGCGCASIDLAVDGRPPSPSFALEQVAPDVYWRGEDGGLCSVFVFAREGTLAGLEVWSVDGGETPVSLPAVDQLRGEAELPLP